MRFGLKSLGVMVALFAVLTLAFSWGYRQLNGQSGVQQTASTANRIFARRIVLPASATDVNFYADFCWIEADFEISETLFLSWCKERGWVPDIVDSNACVTFTPARTAPVVDEGTSEVSRGYRIQTKAGTIVFDGDRGRACIKHYDC